MVEVTITWVFSQDVLSTSQVDIDLLHSSCDSIRGAWAAEVTFVMNDVLSGYNSVGSVFPVFDVELVSVIP